jgi:hypothetical protein
MTRLRSCYRSISSFSTSFTTSKMIAKSAAFAGLLATLTCFAQDQPPTGNPPSTGHPQIQAENQSATVTIPAGTRMALVLTQPIESRYMRRGDDIYAQTTSPVNAGNEMVIPPGTFVQGTLDKFERRGGRGEIHLSSMSITFPDGYVAPISGPLTLGTSNGYLLVDPGRNGMLAVFLPAAGAGVGALIGHSVGTSSSTLTSSLPPGCMPGTIGCLSSSMTVPGNSGKNTVIGAAVGGGVGFVVGMTLLFHTHHFLLAAGAPAQVTLGSPVSLLQDEVARAVAESVEHPVAVQPVAPPPLPPFPPPYSGPPNVPGTPGTPPVIIPGPPGPGGVPGPPVVIPGTPPSGS